jgi:ABC-2 type transport system permease protein
MPLGNVLVMMELELRRIRHDRTELYSRAIQPILWLAVFGPVMGALRAIPTGQVPYTDFITAGVLVQSITFVSIFYGLQIVWERDSGILKKLLVTPTSRYALVIGRSMASGVRAIFQMAIIFLVALLLGVTFVPNVLNLALAVVILFFASGGLAALSILITSLMKTRERVMGIGQAIIMPLFFASNALYPIAMMPPVLQYIAMGNPLSYIVDAVRSLTITGDLAMLPIDILAIAMFDVAVFILASISFRKVIQ